LLVDEQLDVARAWRRYSLGLWTTLCGRIALGAPQEFLNLIAQGVGLLRGQRRLWTRCLSALWRLGRFVGFDDFLNDPEHERAKRNHGADDAIDVGN
jgi:hypothetical protein